MKTVLIVVTAVLAFSCSAFAQQQPTPREQALLWKLGTEVESGVQCNTVLVQNQQQLARAQARIRELEAKYEPKPVEPAAPAK